MAPLEDVPPDASTEQVVPSQASVPPCDRIYGPVVVWTQQNGRAARPHLLFRPTRFSVQELKEDVVRRQNDAAREWQLSYGLSSRTDCRLLQVLLEDHGFVKTTARAHGHGVVNLIWLSSAVKPALLLSLNRFQKVNHFPRASELTRKDLLVRTLTATREAHGVAACDFLPLTYVLPADADALHGAMQRERGAWIVKPIASSRGRGISIVQQPHQLPHDDVVVSRCAHPARPPLAARTARVRGARATARRSHRRYVARPLLIEGFKFDLRLYVAVTSFDPLRVYVFDEGLARFSTEQATEPPLRTC